MHNIPKARFGETPIAEQGPADTVAANLYRTYWFAQGDENLDGAFGALLSQQYRTEWSPTDLAEAVASTGNPNDPAFMRLQVPSGHGSVRNPNAEVDKAEAMGASVLARRDFDIRWQRTHQKLTMPEPLSSTMDFYSRMAEDLLMSIDKKYNVGERVRRFSPTDDPRASIYQLYVLQGRPTGSREFDAIFAGLRDRFVDIGPPKGYGALVNAWQEYHPTETFEIPGEDIKLAHIKGERTDRGRPSQVVAIPVGNLLVRQ